MRLFPGAERDLLRHVMALVPNVSDARDVVQETAIALWEAIGMYDPARPFVPWACRFALNEARMHLRTESRRRRFIEEDVAALLAERRLEQRRKLLAAGWMAGDSACGEPWRKQADGKSAAGRHRHGHSLEVPAQGSPPYNLPCSLVQPRTGPSVEEFAFSPFSPPSTAESSREDLMPRLRKPTRRSF